MKDTVFNKMTFLWMAAGYGSENSDEEQPRSGSLRKALFAGSVLVFPRLRSPVATIMKHLRQVNFME